MFLIDFVCCFCQEYHDDETYMVVSDIKKISMHYLKSSCIYDLLAIIPFTSILSLYQPKPTIRLNKEGIGIAEHIFNITLKKEGLTDEIIRKFRLIKLLRVPRLFELLNVDRFKKFIKEYYNHKLSESVKQNKDGDNYPILKSLMIVKIYMVARLAMIIATASFFLGIIWHIIVVDLLEDKLSNPGDPYSVLKPSFKCNFQADPDDGKFRALVKVWYFSLTTLSTIGYGDYSPLSTDERLISILILLLGVMMFSFIMSQFIEILMNYQSLWQVGSHRDLSKWISLLSRFN